MEHAYICDAIRTPFGRYGGSLAAIRTDDLAAIPLHALLERNPSLDPAAIDDVIFGCANQAGEDNRNVARMALLLAGLPQEVPGSTVNRLCGSSLDAVAHRRARHHVRRSWLVIVGGVESMSRAPFVFRKPDAAVEPQRQKSEDTTIGWRFVNPLMRERYGIDSMAETAENVAAELRTSRAPIRTPSRIAASSARRSGTRRPVSPKKSSRWRFRRKGDPQEFDTDEHPRPDTTLEALAALKPVVKPNGTVTAGNASGINDGAGAVLLASESAAARHGLNALARVVASATAGVAPRIMGLGPRPRRAEGARTHRPAASTRWTSSNSMRPSRRRLWPCCARLGPARRCRSREPQRRRHRARPSAGRQRRAPPHYRRPPTAPHRWPLCAVYHVHRSRSGNRDDS